ncbi:hypothetical protein CSA80_02825 [Candidatus Saccharibacteria bacterium]|nr:MAG: hypothetical protein CR973_02945 [Candidatus Saccharibacteria bacterium]PID99025.1 MAG: hypothetical protein CSA80_02825 [Candidatus Saccharibacteria bacterium]
MLNLLPPHIKQAYRYGRINRHFVRWIIVLLFSIFGVGAITVAGYLYLNESTKNYSTQVANTRRQLDAQNLKGVQNEVKDISNNLKLVVNVLSKQVLFSELLTQITTLMPNETNLTGLSISQTEGAIDITAAAKTYAAATQIHVNLSDKDNNVFSKADIVSVNCSGNSAYPCTIAIRALFADNSSYMLIQKKGGGNGQ